MIPLRGIADGRRRNIVNVCGAQLINVKTLCVNPDHPDHMNNDPLDAEHYLRKAKKYRDKARVTLDPRVKSALEAVAREFTRKARALGTTAPRRAFQ
jgi:hypothetical protein